MIRLFKQKKLFGVLILLCVAAAGSMLFVVQEKNKSVSRRSAQSGWGIQGVEGFVITQSFDDGFVAEQGREVMKIKETRGASEEQAQRNRDEWAILLEGLFVLQLPPYPEFLMQESACGEKYQPVKKETKYGIYYVLFANDRFGYGVCADDLIAHRAGTGFFYCPAKETIVKIEIFSDAGASGESVEKFLSSFVCGR